MSAATKMGKFCLWLLVVFVLAAVILTAYAVHLEHLAIRP